MNAGIVAHDVFCLYPTPRGHVAALRGLTLEVAAGERVVVHGPNGSGKTTLLRVLSGELAPSAGIVRVAGVDLMGAESAERTWLRSRQLGLVDQHHARTLRPELDVRDNVALQLRLAGLAAAAARDRAIESLESLGLAHLSDRRPPTLSGGEAQRVAVCAALAHGPTLVLADEPTGELDRVAADAVYDLLVQATTALGAALLLVSHDIRAGRVADRVVRIRDGRLSEEWTPGTAGSETLVVDDRGWLRLPEALRHGTGVGAGATAGVHAEADGGRIVLTGRARAAGQEDSPDAAYLARDGGGGELIESSLTGDVTDLSDAPQATPVAAKARRPRRGTVVAELVDVSVSRGGRDLLASLSLAVGSGRLTVVQGPSGSGKTTLLRLLTGLERPDSGLVRIAGTDLAGLSRADLAGVRKAHLTVAGQSGSLLETLDVRENLELVRDARGLPPDPDLVERWIDALGLAPLRHRHVRVLSGGERQRVAVARALAVDPMLTVMDEPTSQQDEANAERLVAVLASAAQRGMAVVAATHDPVLVAAAHHVVTLG